MQGTWAPHTAPCFVFVAEGRQSLQCNYRGSQRLPSGIEEEPDVIKNTYYSNKIIILITSGILQSPAPMLSSILRVRVKGGASSPGHIPTGME